MAAFSGMGGSVTFASTSYDVKEWTVTVNSDLQDVTTTGSQGWAEFLPCVNSADCSFTAFEGTSDFSGGILPGTSAAATFTLGNSSAYSGTVLIGSAGIKNDCKSPVEFTCSGKFTGEVTYPA